jgi:addiction module HigA family antidote
MTKPKAIYAIHPGEILKTEFMDPMSISVYALAKALNFTGIYEVVRGERAISADTALRLGNILACQRNSGSICRTIMIFV